MTDSPDVPVFLGIPHRSSDEADIVVLPVPYEATVSFGSGTGGGPEAILGASEQVELFDEVFGVDVSGRLAIHQLPFLLPEPGEPPERFLARVGETARPHVEAGRFLIAIGGEHSISPPLVAQIHRRHPDLLVVQIDAHADLRDEWGGTPHSHACAMRRVLDLGCELVQIGIRNLSEEEHRLLAALPPGRVTTFWDHRLRRTGIRPALDYLSDRAAGRPVYLTIDADGLSPAVVPGTGTPEPGGLSWYDATDLIELLFARSAVAAVDLVEVAPIPGSVVSEFAAAKLLYKAVTCRALPG